MPVQGLERALARIDDALLRKQLLSGASSKRAASGDALAELVEEALDIGVEATATLLSDGTRAALQAHYALHDVPDAIEAHIKLQVAAAGGLARFTAELPNAVLQSIAADLGFAAEVHKREVLCEEIVLRGAEGLFELQRLETLKAVCSRIGVSGTGKKQLLIERIMRQLMPPSPTDESTGDAPPPSPPHTAASATSATAGGSVVSTLSSVRPAGKAAKSRSRGVGATDPTLGGFLVDDDQSDVASSASFLPTDSESSAAEDGKPRPTLDSIKPGITPRELSRVRLVELQQYCALHDLDTAGKKPQLLRTIVRHLAAKSGAPLPAAEPPARRKSGVRGVSTSLTAGSKRKPSAAAAAAAAAGDDSGDESDSNKRWRSHE